MVLASCQTVGLVFGKSVVVVGLLLCWWLLCESAGAVVKGVAVMLGLPGFWFWHAPGQGSARGLQRCCCWLACGPGLAEVVMLEHRCWSLVALGSGVNSLLPWRRWWWRCAAGYVVAAVVGGGQVSMY